MISSNTYVKEVLRTESVDMAEIFHRIQDPQTMRLLHAAMGFSTEAGEFMDILKKHIFYGKPLDFPNAREEVGDLFWYAGIAIDVLQTTMKEVLTANIEKLRQRYPEKFTSDAALNRNVDAEIEMMTKVHDQLSKVDAS
jgi:NTP pyrophosphatase (non-canonical NTP hydrolase)